MSNNLFKIQAITDDALIILQIKNAQRKLHLIKMGKK